jgi:hypothetical protein
MRTRHGSLLEELKAGTVPDDLKGAVEAFKEQFLAAEAERRAIDPTATEAGEVGEAESQKTLATE